MKKNIFKFGALFAIVVAAVSMVSCNGDDGELGPAGTNGTNGTNGANGANGANGVGNDQALSRGKVTVALEGTRPDGVAFTKTVEYAYAASDLDYSQLHREEPGTNDDNSTQILRYQGWDGLNAGSYQGRYYLSWSRSQISQDGAYDLFFQQEIIRASVEFPTEKKQFQLEANFSFSKYFDNEVGEFVYDGNLTDAEVISFVSTPGNDGKFGYKYTGTISDDYNNTGYDLKITVTGDVLVYENLEGGSISGPGRVASTFGSLLTGGKKTTKAEMMPL
jgi:hypothetical protein